MQRGAIILCGGQSTRMGTPKEWLPFGDETLLARVVRIVGGACPAVVVVKSSNQQSLPPLDSRVLVTHDARPNRGPLEGIAAGLAALPQEVASTFVTTCDAPLIRQAFIERLFDLLAEHAAAVPQVDDRWHPLSAVYRTDTLDAVRELLARDELPARLLLECVPTRRVRAEELRDVDPELDSLRNLNRPDEYLAALTVAGLPATTEFSRQHPAGLSP